MEEALISHIEKLLQGSFKESGVVELENLLGTVDSKNRLIPTLDELNNSFSRISGIRILDERDGIKLKFTKGVISDRLTKDQLDKAYSKYQKILGENK
jgi:hypothetical protein